MISAKHLCFNTVLLCSLLPSLAVAQFTMRTVVKDFVTTEWTLECPDGGMLDLGTVDLTEKGMMLFFECLNDIESKVGINIKSKTVVRDFVAESDETVTTTSMSADQVAKLKKIIDENRVPANPIPSTRPRIESVLLNGELDSFIIDLGRGCILDLTDANLPAQVLQELMQLIDQIEAENGVHVSGTTRVKDGAVEKDRVITVSHLTEPQIQRILQFLQSKNVALAIWQKACGVHMTGTVHANGQAIPFDVKGHMTFQFPPRDPETGQQPVDIQDMQLHSVDPLGPFVRLDPMPFPTLMMIEPTGPDGLRHLLIGQPFLGLVVGNIGPNLDLFVAHPDSPQAFEFLGGGVWPNFKPMQLHAPGLLPMTVPGDPQQPQPGPAPMAAQVQINCFELQLPLRVPVIPAGFFQ